MENEAIPENIDLNELKEKIKDPEVGLILFTSSTYEKYKNLIEHTEKRKTKVTPIFMRIPEYGIKDAEIDDVDLMIKKALGVKIGGFNE